MLTMVKEVEKWWNQSSKDFQKTAKMKLSDIHWGVHAPYEKELKLLGKIKGKKVIEVGCGGGQNSIALAKKGAKVTGIDLSKEQLKFAENLAKKERVKVNFIKGDFQKLSKYVKKESFDIALSSWAFQYSPDLNKLFKEVYKVLKKNGKFVFAMPHPFQDIIDPMEFKKKRRIKFERSYFDTGRYEEVGVVKGEKRVFVGFHVKVSDIFNALVKAGFKVEKILEPLSLEDSGFEYYYPKRLSKLVPATIVFKAVKSYCK